MNSIYKKLIEGHKRYGTTIEDITKHCLDTDASLIKENVVIAPTMKYEFWKDYGAEITVLHNGYHIFSNIKVKNKEFTFITTGIGAPNLVDIVLGLGTTNCKNIIFIGSVGSLDEKINIGDIVIPKYSICGDGVCKYLTGKPIKNSYVYGEKYYPNKELFNKTIESTKSICEKQNISWHIAENFSVDTIFAQFAHVDEIKKLGSRVIEMETASLFRASEICNIKATAIFCVSDNTVNKKSLFSGRTQKDKQKKGYSRYIITPEIVLDILQ